MQLSTITSLFAFTLAAFTGLAGVADSSPVPAYHRVPPHPPQKHHTGGSVKHTSSSNKHNNGKHRSGTVKHSKPKYGSHGKPKHHSLAGIKGPGQVDFGDESIKDTSGLSDSKRKPPLVSGNIVITADPSIVLRSNDPNASFPPNAAFRHKQGLDTLRGFLNFKRNDTTGADDVETTMVVFDVPEIAKGKYCSFHFLFGSGDSSHVREEIILWSLTDIPVEFDTTWLDKPARYRQVAQIHPGIGPKVSLGGEGNDAVFKYEDTPIVPHKSIKTLSESPAFPCDPVLGKTAYELVIRPTQFDQKGRAIVQSAAWSMNKGLMIEIHGVKAQTPEEASRKEYDTDNFEVEDEEKYKKLVDEIEDDEDDDDEDDDDDDDDEY